MYGAKAFVWVVEEAGVKLLEMIADIKVMFVERGLAYQLSRVYLQVARNTLEL